jgi:hypothetical protein
MHCAQQVYMAVSCVGVCMLMHVARSTAGAVMLQGLAPVSTAGCDGQTLPSNEGRCVVLLWGQCLTCFW